MRPHPRASMEDQELTQEEVEEQIRLKLDRAQRRCYEHLKRQYTTYLC